MYVARNENTQIYLPSVKDTFISTKNKIYLSKIISKQLYTSNNNIRYTQLENDINKEIDNWVNKGKLNNLAETADIVSNDITLQLNYYNSLFITHYLNKNTNLDQYQFELDNNPYKQVTIINGEKKKFKDFLASDYENMSVSNYQDAFTGRFDNKYNEIPFYRKALHNRNVDRSLSGNEINSESKINMKYKKYDNSDLLNNVSYLRKQKPSNHKWSNESKTSS